MVLTLPEWENPGQIYLTFIYSLKQESRAALTAVTPTGKKKITHILINKPSTPKPRAGIKL